MSEATSPVVVDPDGAEVVIPNAQFWADYSDSARRANGAVENIVGLIIRADREQIWEAVTDPATDKPFQSFASYIEHIRRSEADLPMDKRTLVDLAKSVRDAVMLELHSRDRLGLISKRSGAALFGCSETTITTGTKAIEAAHKVVTREAERAAQPPTGPTDPAAAGDPAADLAAADPGRAAWLEAQQLRAEADPAADRLIAALKRHAEADLLWCDHSKRDAVLAAARALVSRAEAAQHQYEANCVSWLAAEAEHVPPTDDAADDAAADAAAAAAEAQPGRGRSRR